MSFERKKQRSHLHEYRQEGEMDESGGINAARNTKTLDRVLIKDHRGDPEDLALWDDSTSAFHFQW